MGLLVTLALALAVAPNASAHTAFVCGSSGCTTGASGSGPFHLELGWEHEPPMVDQQNSVHFEIDQNTANTPGIDGINPGNFTVTISFGSKMATLPALYQNLPAESGVYLTDLTPTQPGTYHVHVVGKVNDQTPVDIQTDLQQVEASTLGFPDTNPSQAQTASDLASAKQSIATLQQSQTDQGSRSASLSSQVSSLQTDRDNLQVLAFAALGVGSAGLVLGLVGLIVGASASGRARRQVMAALSAPRQGVVIGTPARPASPPAQRPGQPPR